MIEKKFNFGKFEYKYFLIKELRKTIRLTVKPDGDIWVKSPQNYSILKIEDFLKRKWLWLEKQIAYFSKYKKISGKKDFVSGESFWYLGRQYVLEVVKSQQDLVNLKSSKMIVQTYLLDPKQIVENWYKQNTERIFQKRLKKMSSKFGLKDIPKLGIRKMNKRWGSFLGSQKVLLNPELVKAPKECIDYVITHELCHFKHKSHNRQFFELLSIKYPGWEKVKEKLEVRMSEII